MTARLFAAADPSLAAHLDAFGPLPATGPELIQTLGESGLSGRGGAGFPTARKMAALTGPRRVVVGNGAEGEPLSRKDARLLTGAPHLVLDGLQAAAAAVGADALYLYVHPDSVDAVNAALAERHEAGIDPQGITVVEAPDRFVAGEESAAIRRIEGGPALPRDRTVIAAVSGVRGRPTLVNNVETLANVALIARRGAAWFRSEGDPEDPGTMLITISGALARHGVIEVPTGVPLDGVLQWAGADPSGVQALLIGGYHGTWITAGQLGGLRLSWSGLRSLGASPGAGILHAIGRTECGLAVTAEIAGFLAEQSARQCGPCLKGLPRLAELLNDLAFGQADDALIKEIRRLARLVDGRGACRHPDGTARMIRSALQAFAEDIELHGRRRCVAADAAVG